MNSQAHGPLQTDTGVAAEHERPEPSSPPAFAYLHPLPLLALALLTLLAGGLRFYATSFGLPDKFRPDEEYLVSRALDFERDWNPHFALYPAAQMYLQHGALLAYARLHGVGGDFRAAYGADNQALAYLVARRVSAALGTATIPALYFAAAPLYGPGAGLVGATIMALAPLHARDSKFATTDVAMAFWVTLALAMLLELIRRGRALEYLLAGGLIGVAAATKYPAAVLLPVLALAHLERARVEGRGWLQTLLDERPYMALCAFVIAFLCLTPYLLIDWSQTLHDFAYQRGFELYGVNNPQAAIGLRYLFLALRNGMGLRLGGLIILALIAALFDWRPGVPSLLCFIVLGAAGLVTSHYVFYRYLLVPLPAMSILAGLLLSRLTALISIRLRLRRAGFIVALLFIYAMYPALARDLALDRLLARPDTRTLARQWIASHVPVGSLIAATAATTPYGKPQLGPQYRLVPITAPSLLKAQGIQWVMADSMPQLAYYSPGPTAAELAQLKQSAKLMFEVNPLAGTGQQPVFDPADAFYAPLRHVRAMSNPGPRIRIWKLN